jgi:hypothetical protein
MTLSIAGDKFVFRNASATVIADKADADTSTLNQFKPGNHPEIPLTTVYGGDDGTIFATTGTKIDGKTFTVGALEAGKAGGTLETGWYGSKNGTTVTANSQFDKVWWRAIGNNQYCPIGGGGGGAGGAGQAANTAAGKGVPGNANRKAGVKA